MKFKRDSVIDHLNVNKSLISTIVTMTLAVFHNIQQLVEKSWSELLEIYAKCKSSPLSPIPSRVANEEDVYLQTAATNASYSIHKWALS